MERKEKSYKMYGQAIEKFQKDLKAKKDEIEVLKKMLLVKMHQIDTNGIKIIKLIKQEKAISE